MTQDWIIGFIWGVGTIAGSYLRIRYNNRILLQAILDIYDSKCRPHNLANGKTAILLPLDHVLTKRLFSLGWTGRKNPNRQFPVGEINEREFINGYCYTKMTVDNYRIRIYGSKGIVSSIDNYLQRTIQTTPKTPQQCLGKTQDGYSGQCWAIYYQSKAEVPRILEIIGRPSSGRVPQIAS